MDRLNEKLRGLGEHAHAEVERRPPPKAPVRRVKRQRFAIVGSLSGLVVLSVALSGVFLLRSEPSTDVVAKDEWVAAGSVKEIRDRYVVYVEDHEAFVLTMGDRFVGLSAWSPIEEEGERQRMLYCTLSNLFESDGGPSYDRSGVPLDAYAAGSRERMASVAVRVRDGMVEIAPERISDNDLDPFGGSVGPPCGEWGPVVEGPPGFALATEAPPEENKASLHPARVEMGQAAELRFAPVHTSGLRWDLYRFDGELWQWHGILVAGPGYRSYFDLPPLDPSGGIDDIGFGGSYVMDIKIPKLEPGRYRLATYAIKGGNDLSIEERQIWHYADFEVTE